MSPIYCQQCKRANGADAKRCIWCGVPITGQAGDGRLDATRVEISYLDGIDRFEDPMPVRLIISSEGIEVAELIPGTRTFKIPARSVLGANVVDASTMIAGKRKRSMWWWLALGPAALLIPGKKTPDIKEHDYILTIRYKDEKDVRNVVFQRRDRAGLAVVEGLARIVAMLTQQK